MTVIYTFTPSKDACTACSSRPLYSHSIPSRPHDNCKCTIDFLLAVVEEKSRTKTLLAPSNTMETTIALVTPNDCLEESVTVSSTEDIGWELGFGGGKIGQSVEEGKTHTRKQKFCHGEVCEGTEAIIGVYELREYLITIEYVAISLLLGPSGFTWVEYERASEIVLVNLKTECV